MQRSQLNDLFQSSLVFSLAALFGLALISDLRSPASSQQATQIAQAQTVARS